MDIFGSSDPKEMPEHFFSNAIGVDYSTAVRANVAAQPSGIAPRHWYVDARYRCTACEIEFTWSAYEQQQWFEELQIFVDAEPNLCGRCWRRRCYARRLRKEYDSVVGAARAGGDLEQKQRVVDIVDEVHDNSYVIPDRMRETRELFLRQLCRDQQ